MRTLKSTRLVVVSLLTIASGSAFGQEARLPTDRDMAKLIEAAWADPPSSIDVTWYMQETQRPMTMAQIHSNVEASFAASDVVGLNKEPVSRSNEIDLECQRIFKERAEPRLSKQEIRLSGYCYRMDEWSAVPNSSLGKLGELSRTIANIGNPGANDFTHFEINYLSRSAKLMGDKQRWLQEPVLEFCGLPFAARALLRAFLGKVAIVNGRQTVIPDPNLMRQVQNGTNAKLHLLIAPTAKDADRRVELRMAFLNISKAPLLVLTCDSENYSLPYNFEQHDPKTLKIVETRAFSAFDEQGFPRNIFMQRFDAIGGLIASEKMAVEKVILNPQLDKELFVCRPPDGFAIVDYRFQKPVVIDVPSMSSPAAVSARLNNLTGSTQSMQSASPSGSSTQPSSLRGWSMSSPSFMGVAWDKIGQGVLVLMIVISFSAVLISILIKKK